MHTGYKDSLDVDFLGPTCTVYKSGIFWKARVAHEWKRGFTKKHAVRKAMNDYRFMLNTEYEVMSLHEARRYYAP